MEEKVLSDKDKVLDDLKDIALALKNIQSACDELFTDINKIIEKEG